ncbi:hypothetical protein QU24_20320 [Pantoea rodasii]|uniref:NAD-dependent epimerase/dehydratase domain-containing protein n=1 Tax=Pantoea rodasii TaxID=1076549 RepID=A0A0B1R580_9GAMM|nr:NAD-dependent epimerase/dehydratase family protein [Pantoea rodasii]KHJ66235.1 hypothetical protein QU24_20320 [Pantoea rodasii]
MNNLPQVAVIGARGAIGEHVVAHLAATTRLRAASRQRPATPHAHVEYQQLDLFDHCALRQFCQGSQLIINCAAPGSLIGDRVARVAEELCCDYLDPGGDDALYGLLSNARQSSQCFVVSTGMLPGLSGLLLRSAFSAFEHLLEAKGYALSCEPFSYGGAADFLASLDNGYGVAGVALRQGEMKICAGEAQVQLPLAQFTAQAYPFMTSEWQRIGESHPTSDLTWYNLFASEEMVQWLSHCPDRDPQAARALVALSLQTFAGQQPQHVLAVEARGWHRGEIQQRACVIECASGAQLTAAMTAYTALQMLQGALPAGVHFAADVLPPTQTLQFLQQHLENFCWLELPALASDEEGAI